MVLVEKVSGGRVNVRGMGHYEIGDRDDLSEADAAYLVDERGDFAYVDEAEGDGDELPEPASLGKDMSHEGQIDLSWSDEDGQDAAAEAAADDEGDGTKLTAQGLADDHWQRTVSAIESGDADDVLDELEELDDRPSVQGAIDERRAELEG